MDWTMFPKSLILWADLKSPVAFQEKVRYITS